MSITPRSVAVSSALITLLGKIAGALSRIPTIALAAAALCTMLGGIILSALTTTDPLWWQAHFSQLGTFHNLSATFFNGGLILAGVLVVLFAGRVWSDIARLGHRGGFPGAATVAFLCLTVIGINLSLVGLIPMNTDRLLHDRVAGSMVLGFLALLLSSPVMLHRLPRRLIWATLGTLLWTGVSIALFVTAVINLTLFEVLAFSAMFTWAGIFVSCLAAHEKLLETMPSCALCSPAQNASQPVKWGYRRSVGVRKLPQLQSLCLCE